MIQTSANNADHLTTEVDNFCSLSLVILSVPLASETIHLCLVIRRKGEPLHLSMRGDRTSNNEVLEGVIVFIVW